ncbi:MAG: tRNA pseudouridine(38-40) synthase TruA [Paludibacteraceae bacterium]|nr:tRNA pseudouridine(38-40) synthase TruA [Paludibacteraceae bacterium]
MVNRKRYFISFAYDGTSFHGSQSQPNGITVQETMESAFATILREQVALTFAGRTDAGVHAEAMVAHFDFDKNLPANLAARLNNLLPPSIAIRSITPVKEDAHARFDAIARTYYYRITTRKDPFTYHTHTRVAQGLDFEAMNIAAQHLLGTQDFASFCRAHTDVKTTICTVTEARWIQKNEDEAIFVITADRFLRNMVRAVVGTLFEVGRGRLTEAQFVDIIASHDRQRAGHSAPAEGLSLVHIQYPVSVVSH